MLGYVCVRVHLYLLCVCLYIYRNECCLLSCSYGHLPAPLLPPVEHVLSILELEFGSVSTASSVGLRMTKVHTIQGSHFRVAALLASSFGTLGLWNPCMHVSRRRNTSSNTDPDVHGLYFV
jgi:hypothetical protein